MKKLILIAVAAIIGIALISVVGVRMLLNPERVRAAVEAQASAALGLPVKIQSADIQLWPRAGLTVDGVTVGTPAEITLTRARMSTGLGPLLSKRVEDAELVVEDSRLDLVKLLATLEGLADAQASGPGAAGGATSEAGEAAAFTIVSVRSIGLKNVELVAGTRQATVTLESTFAGDRLEISRLSAKTAGTTLEATGAVESVSKRVARLTIDAEPLDLDGLMQFASAFSQAPTPAAGRSTTSTVDAPAALDLRADVRAKSGMVAGLTFSDLQTTIAVTPGHVTLSPLTLGALDGRFDGTASVALSGAAPEVALSGKVAGVNLQTLAAFASGAPSEMTGTLNMDAQVRSRGLDTNSAIKNATGNADVSLLNGRIPGLQLVRPAVLAFGKPQGSALSEGNGEAFERITATITIDRGQLRTNNLVFASRDVDMSGMGSLAAAGGALDLHANLKLSEELSAQAGRDLVRYTRDGNRVVLPATVSGTVASPFVMIDMKQAAQRALTNEIQNRATSALDRLMGRGKKPPKD